MNLNKKIKENHEKLIFFIIAFNVLFKSLIFIFKPNIWWDSASYVGMGKAIFSLGSIGFWNPVRPLILPIYLGFIDKIGLSPIFFGRVLQIIASSLIIYLVYKISLKLFKDHKVSLLSSLFLLFDPIIYENILELYTSTLALCFALFSFYYYLKFRESEFKENKYLFIVALFAGLSFLTRYTFLFIFIVLSISLVLDIKLKNFKIIFKKTSLFAFFYGITLLPFFMLNYFIYPSILYPLLKGSYDIKLNGLTILYPKSFFLVNIPKVAFITLFIIFGLYFIFKKYDDKKNVLLLMLLIPLLYHIFLVPVKVLRYSIIFLPYIYILSAYGLTQLFNKKNKILNIALIFIISVSIISSSILDLSYLRQNQNQNILEQNYYNYFNDAKYKGSIVLAESPYPLLYSDIRMYSFFFPDLKTLKDFENNYSNFYVMTSSSYNLCQKELPLCQEQLFNANQAYSYLEENYLLLKNITVYNSVYYIYEYSI